MSTELPSPPAAEVTPRRVPEAYVRAEILAAPLTSTEAFLDALIELNPELSEGSATFRLWRDCERTLVEHGSGWSLDRLVAARDFGWFHGVRERRTADGQRERVPLHRYLLHVAASTLRSQHGATRPELGESLRDLDAVTYHRWLCLALPEDLLLAALPVEPPPSVVEYGHELARRRLADDGVAEIHVHLNGAMDFTLNWTGVLAAIADPTLASDILMSPGMPFDENPELLLRWLLVAGIGRLALHEFLTSSHAENGTFATFVDEVYLKRGNRSQRRVVLLRALAALRHPRRGPPSYASVRDLYGLLTRRVGCCGGRVPVTLREVRSTCDPLAAMRGLKGPGEGERWLIRHGLRYLQSREPSPDQLFAALFWGIVRIRCIYFRYVVQRPLTAGIQWFIRFFDRIRRLRRPLESVLPEAAYELETRAECLTALEARVSGNADVRECARCLLRTLRSWKNVLADIGRSSPPEFGVLIHFCKERDGEALWQGGRPSPHGEKTYAQPGWMATHHGTSSCGTQGRAGLARVEEHGRAFGEELLSSVAALRYAPFISKEGRVAESLGLLVCSVPHLLWLVRGIDVASDELGVPTWAIAPLYAYVRAAAAYASVLPRASGAPMLRMTAHAGEDFRHLMEGLRRIHESVQYLLEFEGRIGHGTALGVEPQAWAEATGAVLMPMEERLWDLLFEWRLYTGTEVPADFVAAPPPGRESQLAEQIIAVSTAVFGRPVAPRVLAQMRHDLHRIMSARSGRVSVPSGHSFQAALRRMCQQRGAVMEFGREEVEVLIQYLSDRSTFRRGQELCDVAIDAREVSALRAVQTAMRTAIRGRGIVIELNPSSNLLIGDMLDLRNHPALRLLPVEPTPDLPEVPVAVGSDDPLTFGTSLTREYDHLRNAARAAGYAEPSVLAWLDRIRRTSLDARFTVRWRPDAMTRARALINALEEFLAPSTRGARRLADWQSQLVEARRGRHEEVS